LKEKQKKYRTSAGEMERPATGEVELDEDRPRYIDMDNGKGLCPGVDEYKLNRKLK